MSKPYNVKLIHYPTGKVQIRKYSRPLCEKQPTKKNSKAKESRKIVEIEGFGDCIVLENFKEYQAFCKERDLKLYQSLQNTKKNLYMIARSVEWEWMLTITFDSKKIQYERSDYQSCAKQVCQFFRNQRRSSPDIKFLIIGEPHKKYDSWHFHCLVADAPGMKFTDSGRESIGKKSYKRVYLVRKGLKGRTIYNVSGWNYGFSTATVIDSDSYEKVSRYVLKYISKTLVSNIRGKGVHRYYVSKNIPKPEIVTENIKQEYMDEYIDEKLKEYNKEIDKVYTSSRYVDTTIMELKDIEN